MQFKPPKNDDKIIWTRHVVSKMRQYGLSETRLRYLLRHYQRLEKGIAPGTIAVMRSAETKKHPSEVWLMYQAVEGRIKIITAWRYPGVSSEGEGVPIPEDIVKELTP